MQHPRLAVATFVLVLTASSAPAATRQQIEADWLAQAQQWSIAPGQSTTPTADFRRAGAEAVQRARRLAEYLGSKGLDTKTCLSELDHVAAELEKPPQTAPAENARTLYLRARRAWRKLAFAEPALDFDRLLFVKRFTQETYPDVCLNHMPWVSRPGGDLCIVSGWKAETEPKVQTLLKGALGPGHVHGIDLWWDASRVVFGYAKSPGDGPVKGFPGRLGHDARLAAEPIHLFEIGSDGKGLRQLTGHKSWSDLDPAYCPNGDIVFVSERCATSLQCNEYDKDETSCNLYVMHPNGNGIRRLSANKDGDYVPHALDDGTIGYTRWEYHERNLMENQSLWTIHPDGTGADALYKQHMSQPLALYDARSLPGGKKLVAVAGGHHTLYCGPVVLVDRSTGMNDARGLTIVTPNVMPPEGGMTGLPVAEGGVHDRGGVYMNPWPLTEKQFLVSYTCREQTDPRGYALYLIDVFGTKELIYRDPAISSFAPIPLRPRPVPPRLPDMTDPAAETATCTLSNVAYGVEGLDPQRIRYVRVAEIIAWPYEMQSGGQRYGEHHMHAPQLPNWTPVRILGDVPLDRDGSARFTVPVDRMIYFQLLDADRMELRRMRSFISFQPGETRGCVGCHETRCAAGAAVSSEAAARGAATPLLPPWGPRTLNFLRDVQPVLDRHCTACHGGLKPAGGIDFSGGLTSHNKDIPGYGWNRAYETMRAKRLVAVASVNADLSVTPPLAFGSHKSKLIEVLRDGPCGQRVKLDQEDWLRLTMWIDANAPYHDGFVNKRPAVAPYDLAADQALLGRMTAVHQRRCAQCHQPSEVSRLDWIDIHNPADSPFLKAPLAKVSGGSGKCRPAAIYRDSSDADYKALAEAVRQAVQKAWERPRRDLVHWP